MTQLYSAGSRIFQRLRLLPPPPSPFPLFFTWPPKGGGGGVKPPNPLDPPLHKSKRFQPKEIIKPSRSCMRVPIGMSVHGMIMIY